MANNRDWLERGAASSVFGAVLAYPIMKVSDILWDMLSNNPVAIVVVYLTLVVLIWRVLGFFDRYKPKELPLPPMPLPVAQADRHDYIDEKSDEMLLLIKSKQTVLFGTIKIRAVDWHIHESRQIHIQEFIGFLEELIKKEYIEYRTKTTYDGVAYVGISADGERRINELRNKPKNG